MTILTAVTTVISDAHALAAHTNIETHDDARDVSITSVCSNTTYVAL
jgi:hypothetical protein